MLKRLMFLLFGIDGIISIETYPDLKIAIIRWRVRSKTWDGTIDLSGFTKNVPKGWQVLLITERW